MHPVLVERNAGGVRDQRSLPTIRTMLALVVLTCVIPAVVGFALLVNHFYERERTQFKRDALLTARALVSAVDRDLDSGKMAALALAASPSLAIDDFAAFHAQATSLLSDEFPGTNFLIMDRSGKQLANTIRPFGEPLPQLPDSPQTRQVFETGKPVILDVFIGGVLRLPKVAIDVPVWRDGKVVYVLGVGFSSERLGKILTEQRLPPNRIVAIFDKQGMIVARTHEPKKFVGQKGVPQLLERMRATHEGEVETSTLEGIPTYAVFSRSSLTGWSVAIGIPKRALLAELLHSVAWISLLVIALLCTGFALAWHLGGKISRSVKALAAPPGPGAVELAPGFLRSFKEADEVAEELKRFRHHLEELVASRTAELSVTKDKAEMANQAKSAFLASMSHELRTPLNAILGYAQILKREKVLNERQAVGLRTIQQSGEHLLTLINDILDLAKIEAGKLELNPSAFNLPVFLRVICDIIRVKAEQKSLLFLYEIGANTPRAVHGDEKRLRQILLNLLGNAVKFTDRGQVALRVRCLSNCDAMARLRFDIEDTGIGMTPEQLSQIFCPFEQVGDIDHRTGGTGLGLAISRQLVRLMDSDIQVESQPGQGSRFWFELAMPVTAEVTVMPANRTVICYQGARKKILIVDDVVANRAMLVDLLSGLGFDTAEAANGQDALDRIAQLQPDLIVMDMVMPVMNGLDATHCLRQLPQWRSVPIIAVSASASQEDQAASLAAGANAFIAKPIDQPALLMQIGALLGLDWVDGQSQEPDISEVQSAQPLVVPPKEQLEALHMLALAGNMQDIRAWANRLRTLDEQYHPLADKLLALARAYQPKAILRLVEEIRNKQ
ncbi:MAG: response regulator [Burkholderiales bacterium]|nr:response regulator [Burkholderiales bacterium]